MRTHRNLRRAARRLVDLIRYAELAEETAIPSCDVLIRLGCANTSAQADKWQSHSLYTKRCQLMSIIETHNLRGCTSEPIDEKASALVLYECALALQTVEATLQSLQYGDY